MTADDINGVDLLDEQRADDLHLQERADRLQDFAPAAASPSGTRPVHGAKTGHRLPPTWEGRRQPTATRTFTGDEARAQMALRPRSGNVLVTAGDSGTFVRVDLDLEIFNNNNNAAAASDSRGA